MPKVPNRRLVGLNTGRRFPWRQRRKRRARTTELCPRCVWSRSTPSTPNSSTTCGWWSASRLCSYASSGSRATCVWAPLPSEPSSGMKCILKAKSCPLADVFLPSQLSFRSNRTGCEAFLFSEYKPFTKQHRFVKAWKTIEKHKVVSAAWMYRPQTAVCLST